MVNPPLGAADDRTSVRFCVAVPVMDRLVVEKLMVKGGGPVVTEVTFTVAMALKKPGALTKISVEPTATGVKVMGAIVLPARTVTVAGAVAIEVSRMATLTTRPEHPQAPRALRS